jgi:AP-3 complex subunit beta
MVSIILMLVNIDALSTPATSALRTLIQLNPEAYTKYIHLLAQSLGEIHSSPARAEIIWLVGEYAAQLGARAADILRISLQDFSDQVLTS